MARRQPRRRTPRRRYRIHFHELGYYQSVVDASTSRQAIRQFEKSLPELTFIGSEERHVIGIDELNDDKTWKALSTDEAELSDAVAAQSKCQPSILDADYPLYVVSTEDAQAVAQHTLGRDLTADELAIVQHKVDFDWQEEIELVIQSYIG